jgi:hypothetical protein
MSTFSNFARQALAGIGAIALTATLLVSSFATSPQVTAVSGVIA